MRHLLDADTTGDRGQQYPDSRKRLAAKPTVVHTSTDDHPLGDL